MQRGVVPIWLIVVAVVVAVGGGGGVLYHRFVYLPKKAVPSPIPTKVASPSPSPEGATPSPSPVKQSSPAAKTGTCSPRGTATCDGQSRPISGPGNAGAGVAGVASGVATLKDVGLKTIQLSTGGTNGLDIDPDTGLVYAVNNSTVGAWCGKSGSRGDSLSIVDPASGKEIASVATEKGPVWPLVDTGNNVVYVATSAEGIIALHKRGTGEKLETIKVGGLPHDIALDKESNVLLVSNTNDGSQQYVAAIDAKTKSILGQHKVASLPHRIMLDAAKRLAYVVSVGSGTISIFNTMNGQPAGQFDTGGKGTIAFSSSTRKLFIPASGQAGQAESIRVINVDTKENVGTISPFLSNAGHQAFGLAVDEKNRLLFASIGDSKYVGVADIDSLKPLAVFEANDCTWGVKIDEKRQLGFVTNTSSGQVTVFDLKKVVSELKR